jgi:hypothetical protein
LKLSLSSFESFPKAHKEVKIRYLVRPGNSKIQFSIQSSPCIQSFHLVKSTSEVTASRFVRGENAIYHSTVKKHPSSPYEFVIVKRKLQWRENEAKSRADFVDVKRRQATFFHSEWRAKASPTEEKMPQQKIA